MERYFNIAGPCFPDEHYMLPALDRLPGIRSFVERRLYFVMHAPRQSGKTTALMALAEELNSGDKMRAVYFTVETAQQFADPNQGIPRIVAAMRNALLRDPVFRDLVRDPASPLPSLLPPAPGLDVKALLSLMAEASDRPLAILFDEVDCLSDGTLITFLRQLRDGYVTRRLSPFPASVALVGMRDIRDYKARIRPDSQTLGSASPFNVIAEDLSIGNFSSEDVGKLYAQHTEATGQVFEPDAVVMAWELTQGQPWLVNAIARECVEKIHGFRHGEPITAADIDEAKESIIRARGTHVDSLMERLKEPRVRRVVEPVIFGGERQVSRDGDDWRYVIDLGLMRENALHELEPANRMYSEIIGRYLTRDTQDDMARTVPETPWATPDGLDMPGLMAAFQSFWRKNAGMMKNAHGYNEALPHLVLMAFLQRVTNGSGHVIREMALGSGRLDLCVEFCGHSYAIEVKTSDNFSRDESYSQLAEYLDKLGLAEGWMPVFDEDKSKPWDEKIFTRDETFGGKTIHVIGL